MPHNPLSHAPGNFDYPPASNSTSANIPTQLENLRRTLQQERERQQQLQDHMDTFMSDSQSPRRRRYLVATGTSTASQPPRAADMRRPAPWSFNGPANGEEEDSRREAPTSEGRRVGPSPPRRPNILRRFRQSHNDASAQLAEASEQLSQAQSRLDALLQDPSLRPLTPPTPQIGSALDRERNRVKRRKLDHDTPAGFQGFQYGHFGQVVSGLLKMQIASCDGGTFGDDVVDPRYRCIYGPDNLLRDDDLVYCTRSSKCNLILRHQGETPFCLERLVIKAPEGDYTAPLQEGMIFVSMTSHGLILKTQGYHPEHILSSSQSSPVSDYADTTQEQGRQELVGHGDFPDRQTDNARGLRRFGMPEHFRPIDITLEGQTPATRPPIWSRRYPADTNALPDTQDMQDGTSPPHQTDTENRDDGFAAVISPYPPLNVTVETCEHSDVEAGFDRAHRTRRLLARRLDEPSEMNDGDQAGPFWDSYRPDYQDQTAGRWARPRRTEGRRSEAGVNGEGNAHNHMPPLLVPHATFFMEQRNSKVVVRFNPPVSGRYILLKFWSPRRHDNIDIQSIVAYGFAGPRYFPSVQMT